MILEGLGAKLLAWALGRGSKYILAGLMVLAVFGYGYMQGVSHVEKKWDEQRQADERVYLDAIVEDVSARESAISGLREELQSASRTRVVVKEIPKYITVEADRACVVPLGFWRLHEGTIAGVLPDTAGRPDDSPSGIPISAVAETDVENILRCKEDRARLRALQGYLNRTTTEVDRDE